MMLRSILVAVLVVGLAGCASLESPGTAGGLRQTLPEAFAHRVASSHVVLYWNCAKPAPDVLRLEGVAQNPWWAQEIRDLKLELVGVGAGDRSVSGAKGNARDYAIRTSQASPFVMDLRTVGSEVRFDLYYNYQFNESEEMDALLAGPPMAPPRLFAQGVQFLVRDVCSESQHRAR